MTGAEALIQQGEKQGIEKGIEEGIEKGIEKGIIQSKREDLLKILGIRIGNIPDAVTNKISRIRSRTRLDSLIEQAIIVDNLDDIIWD